MTVAIDKLEDGAIENLLSMHLQAMHKYSPGESIHAVQPEALKDPALTFWSARVKGELAGCVALKALSSGEAEIKSMKTAEAFLRMGVASRLLAELIKEARSRAYTKLSLETGSHPAFLPAIALYEKYGFRECGPFGNYRPDPYSRFFSLIL